MNRDSPRFEKSVLIGSERKLSISVPNLGGTCLGHDPSDDKRLPWHVLFVGSRLRAWRMMHGTWRSDESVGAKRC